MFIFKYRYYGYWFYTLFKRIIKMSYDKKQKLKIKKHVNEINIL